MDKKIIQIEILTSILPLNQSVMQPQYKSGLALLCIKSYYKGIDQSKNKTKQNYYCNIASRRPKDQWYRIENSGKTLNLH